MKTFYATIKTEFATYYIDFKPNRFGHSGNDWAFMHPTGATYTSSLNECMELLQMREQDFQEQAEVEAVWQLQHA
jgi:hypothetical protein